MNKGKYLSSIAIVILLPILGAGLMFGAVYMFPMSQDNNAIYISYSIIVTCMGLAIPYGMLKAFSAAAHEWDYNEKELHLRDLPKDKDQLENRLAMRRH